jgi:hypothetical protein
MGHSDRHFAQSPSTRPRLSALSRYGRGGKLMGRWHIKPASMAGDPSLGPLAIDLITRY